MVWVVKSCKNCEIPVLRRHDFSIRGCGWFDKVAKLVKFDENRQIVLKRVLDVKRV